MMEQSIREQLNELAEEKYRIFTSTLTPGKENILGVRIPILKKMGVKIIKGDWRTYLEQVLMLATDFIPKIDCWSVCDGFCSGLKITKNHMEQVWEFIQPYLASDKEYDIRFGVVMLLYYISPEYAPLAFAHFNQIKHEGYYVKMAVAWVLSIYYINLPEQTMEYLEKNELDKFTYNKTLQKITESLRIDQTEKARIKGMKRK